MQVLKSLFRISSKQRCPNALAQATTLVTASSDIDAEADSATQFSRPQRNSELIAEEVFRRILRWEQYRAQRSPKFFVLVLMNIEKLLTKHRNRRVLKDILAAIADSMRGTDIAGWYRESTVIGIILTEVQPLERNLLQSLIYAKLSDRLRSKMASEKADQIRYSIYFFPEDWERPLSNELARDVHPPSATTKTEAIAASAKRAMDIIGSVIGLLVFSPFFIVLPIAIKFTSKGPVFFAQDRVGQYGTPFRFLKFRSMKDANDPGIHQEFVKRFIAGAIDIQASGNDVEIVYKLQEDSRVTQIGKFLRKSSLDELPQLINVFKGEMSLVGPRPPIPYEVDAYQYWHRRRLFEAKPGITGLWQVNGRSKTTFDDMVRLDLRYARTRSFWLDLLILLQTPRAVLSGAGAV